MHKLKLNAFQHWDLVTFSVWTNEEFGPDGGRKPEKKIFVSFCVSIVFSVSDRVGALFHAAQENCEKCAQLTATFFVFSVTTNRKQTKWCSYRKVGSRFS